MILDAAEVPEISRQARIVSLHEKDKPCPGIVPHIEEIVFVNAEHSHSGRGVKGRGIRHYFKGDLLRKQPV